MRPRLLTDGSLSERAWQDQVVGLARVSGWMIYHTFDSRHSAAGYPDLTLVRDGRIVLAELKSEHGRLSPAQTAWVAALRATAAEVYIWRPGDWDEVVATLARREAA